MKESEIQTGQMAQDIQDYIEHCDIKSLIELYDFIFNEQSNEIEQIEQKSWKAKSWQFQFPSFPRRAEIKQDLNIIIIEHCESARLDAVLNQTRNAPIF